MDFYALWEGEERNIIFFKLHQLHLWSVWYSNSCYTGTKSHNSEPVEREPWNRFVKRRNNLQNWKTLEFPRWYQTNKKSDLELHIFTDTSTTFYGTVAYFRFRDKGKYKCSFIMSKPRLAPIKEKQLTVPRLELQEAVLACRMKATILEKVKLQVKSVFLWCDSKAVINYINNEKTNFGVFIAHRVNKIRYSSKTEEWFYVPTNWPRWCVGPDFLHEEVASESFSINSITVNKHDDTVLPNDITNEPLENKETKVTNGTSKKTE